MEVPDAPLASALSGPDGPGRYLTHRNPVDALDHLELWLLPWMKRGLESWRLGYEWSERYLARAFLDPIADGEPVGRNIPVPVVAAGDYQ